ncbi:DUF1883 domain-containing protein [Serratia sp. JSRIV001]|uniref:DUF1883 domain-containing protein n=1 Tax=unclassified Serratia (in: enterobacteria) TaxID=2647522 RepID=UPI001CBE6823|nr:DUF1883 domain-containing protein [Serratia sp. JSRIV001]UAN53825.1 DUF1883 domain-containing protein [Serratia sp. JSRIV002]UAN65150.1 DUF1883 domain-containing protein [Serratia sp. JSRIV006]
MLLNNSSRHDRSYLAAGSVVVVHCSHPSIIMLMSDDQYGKYLMGTAVFFYGGYYSEFPANIAVPDSCYWNVIIKPVQNCNEHIEHSILFTDQKKTP